MILSFLRTGVFIAALTVASGPAKADSPRVNWQEIQNGLWFARDQTWGAIKFSALKVHLGYYKLELVDVKSFRDRYIVQLQKLQDNRQSLVDAGVTAIFKTWPQKEDVIAVAPAGWSKSLRSIQQSGLLRIDGKEHAEFEDRESLSAILCLHSPISRYADYDYQVPAFYRTDEQWQFDKANDCSDAVQVGPRIIEDPTKRQEPRGIKEIEKNVRPSIRVVFAIDDPLRSFPSKNSVNNRLRENARDAFIIVTENDVHLWDVQEMLLSPDFYGEGAKPVWAINMAGGAPSGLAVVDPKNKMPITIGNPSGIIGSALVVTKRSK